MVYYVQQANKERLGIITEGRTCGLEAAADAFVVKNVKDKGTNSLSLPPSPPLSEYMYSDIVKFYSQFPYTCMYMYIYTCVCTCQDVFHHYWTIYLCFRFDS